MSEASNGEAGESRAGLVAFQSVDFRKIFGARVLNGLAANMLHIAVGWEVYKVTRDPFALALVGLFMFAPNIMFFLIAGATADRLPRRLVLASCYLLHTAAAASLFFLFSAQTPNMVLVYIALFAIGTGRCFAQPASHAIVPNIVPKEHFTNAVAWGSSGQQIAVIAGPAIGGVLLVAGAPVVFAVVTSLFAANLALMLMITSRQQTFAREPMSVSSMFAGLKFIFNRQIILGAISLDLFAVLFGGAIAMMPIYAADILNVGEVGLGFLRSAIAVGGAACAIGLTQYPIRRHAGRALLISVAVFGAGTIVFGLSVNLYLSLGALVIAGGADAISVFIRQSMVQLGTPDEMRGRVTSVNSMFVGASNELGEFESGTVAVWVGVVPSVVIGGIATIAVAALWAKLFPRLRSVDALSAEGIANQSEA
ncbi:MAG: MFS transporter [Rhodospirillaceae bacterium]|nr:MFS transporter [Rhodospirillaceae bacterium]